MMRALLAHGADVTLPSLAGLTPLMAAVQLSDLDAVRLLHSYFAPLDAVDETGASALSIAISQRSVELVGYLLQAGANANLLPVVTRNPAYGIWVRVVRRKPCPC